VHLKWAAVRLLRQAGARAVLNNLVHFQDVWLEVGIFGQGAGLGMALRESVGTDPAHKRLARCPGGQNNIRLAFVDRAQDLVCDKARHAVHQSGALAKARFKRVGMLGFDI